MAYPSKFKELEALRGKPIAQILLDELNELKDISKVARKLGMSYDNVWDKVNECHIVKDPVVWRISESEVEHAES